MIDNVRLPRVPGVADRFYRHNVKLAGKAVGLK